MNVMGSAAGRVLCCVGQQQLQLDTAHKHIGSCTNYALDLRALSPKAEVGERARCARPSPREADGCILRSRHCRRQQAKSCDIMLTTCGLEHANLSKVARFWAGAANRRYNHVAHGLGGLVHHLIIAVDFFLCIVNFQFIVRRNVRQRHVVPQPLLQAPAPPAVAE
jgi:hypothetical protein